MLDDKWPRTNPPIRDGEISPLLELTPLEKPSLPVAATPRGLVVSPAGYVQPHDENALVLQRQRETFTLHGSDGTLYTGDTTQWRIAAWIKGLICLLALALVVFGLELEIGVVARGFRHVATLIEHLLALRHGLPSLP